MTAMSPGPGCCRQKPIPDRFTRLFRTLSLLILTALSAPLAAQQAPDTPPPSSPYTLHGSARIVLTDVTVKDRAGHIIHDLPASAFHIFDNNHPQAISTFEEHNAAPTAIKETSSTAPNTFSNEFLQHLPPVLNIVVLDTTSLRLTDQMYLAYEFNRFLKTLSPNLPLAIYARVGESTVLVQDFTSDRQLLLAASAKVMPHLPPPGVGNGGGTIATPLLIQIATELAQIPGHKNVLWFTGGINQNFDPLAHPEALRDPGQTDLRQAYDLLEKARVSVYPIDARGVIGVTLEQIAMEDVAKDTGGQAFVNRNALTKISNDILAADNSFYTLVFSPKDFTPDNKWHKLTVKVDGSNYQLSYRRGYYADGFNMEPSNEKKPRTLLLAGGKTRDLPADLHTSPIIFTASIVPFGSSNPEPGKEFYSIQSEPVPPKHMKGYTIRYTLPPDAFNTHIVDGRENATFDIAILASNQAATHHLSMGRRVSVTLPKSHSPATINLAQDINLPPGDLYLYIAVWDTTNGRTGTLQIPFTAH
jgi:VWFA-related protein